MKVLKVTAVAAVAVLALAGCNKTAPTQGPQAAPNYTGVEDGTYTIGVSLQPDPGAEKMKAILDLWKAAHPTITVKVEYNTWDASRIDKWLSSLLKSKGKAAYDVMEMGNTDVITFLPTGLLLDLSGSRGGFYQSDQWLAGLTAAGTYEGRLYGLPYYAGARLLFYRSDLYEKSDVATLDALTAKATSIKTDQDISGVLVTGGNWYFNTSWLFDAGMEEIATFADGKWKGNLNSSAAISGLTALKDFWMKTSKGLASEDESGDFGKMGGGETAAVLAPGWAGCCFGDQFTDVIAATAFPGTSGPMGQFAGGSNVVVAGNTQYPRAAVEFARYLTGEDMGKIWADGGLTPNNGESIKLITSEVGKIGAEAVLVGWFTPSSPNWGKVESGRVLQDFFEQAFAGDITTAANEANERLEGILNLPR